MSEPTNQDRRDDSAMIALVTEVHTDVRQLRDELHHHMKEETHELAAEVAKLMAQAFVDGDPAQHRKRHETELQLMAAKVEFWNKMKYELTRWGLLAFVGWIAIVAWNAFLKGPQ